MSDETATINPDPSELDPGAKGPLEDDYSERDEAADAVIEQLIDEQAADEDDDPIEGAEDEAS